MWVSCVRWGRCACVRAEQEHHLQAFGELVGTSLGMRVWGEGRALGTSCPSILMSWAGQRAPRGPLVRQRRPGTGQTDKARLGELLCL